MITQDRSWAKDLSDLEFNHEYQKRFNVSDVIPSKAKFLKPSKAKEKVIFKSEYRDEYLGEKMLKKEEIKEIPTYACKCGESFAKPLDKARHVKGCETWLKQAT